MTDGEFLELIRKERRLSQEQMADLLGMKSQSTYSYYAKKDAFKAPAIDRFRKKLNLKEWNNRPVMDKDLVQVLYDRLIKLEHKLTKKSIKTIKEEIEDEIDLLRPVKKRG